MSLNVNRNKPLSHAQRWMISNHCFSRGNLLQAEEPPRLRTANVTSNPSSSNHQRSSTTQRSTSSHPWPRWTFSTDQTISTGNNNAKIAKDRRKTPSREGQQKFYTALQSTIKGTLVIRPRDTSQGNSSQGITSIFKETFSFNDTVVYQSPIG